MCNTMFSLWGNAFANNSKVFIVSTGLQCAGFLDMSMLALNMECLLFCRARDSNIQSLLNHMLSAELEKTKSFEERVSQV